MLLYIYIYYSSILFMLVFFWVNIGFFFVMAWKSLSTACIYKHLSPSQFYSQPRHSENQLYCQMELKLLQYLSTVKLLIRGIIKLFHEIIVCYIYAVCLSLSTVIAYPLSTSHRQTNTSFLVTTNAKQQCRSCVIL